MNDTSTMSVKSEKTEDVFLMRDYWTDKGRQKAGVARLTESEAATAKDKGIASDDALRNYKKIVKSLKDDPNAEKKALAEVLTGTPAA